MNEKVNELAEELDETNLGVLLLITLLLIVNIY